MAGPKSKGIKSAERRRRTSDRRRRDAAILRLWQDGWTAPKIAAHLDIALWTISNVVRTRGAARNPRGSRAAITAGLDDAPIEAWQQAMLPKLEDIADTMGLDDASKRAFVFIGLLRLKPYDDIEEFKAWVHAVTGYDRDEITAFIERGMKGYLIVDHQPNAEAFQSLAADDETGYVDVVLMTKVLEGTFCRHEDGAYSLPDGAA
jgi:hypothetical protein